VANDLDRLVSLWDAVDPDEAISAAGQRDPSRPRLSGRHKLAMEAQDDFLHRYPQHAEAWEKLKQGRYRWLGKVGEAREAAIQASGDERPAEQARLRNLERAWLGTAGVSGTFAKGASFGLIDPLGEAGEREAWGLANKGGLAERVASKTLLGGAHVAGLVKGAPLKLAGAALGAGGRALAGHLPARLAPYAATRTAQVAKTGLQFGLASAPDFSKREEKPGALSRFGHGALTGAAFGAASQISSGLSGRLLADSTVGPLAERGIRGAVTAAVEAPIDAAQALMAGEGARGVVDEMLSGALIGLGMGASHNFDAAARSLDADIGRAHKRFKTAEKTLAEASKLGKEVYVTRAQQGVEAARDELLGYRKNRDLIESLRRSDGLAARANESLREVAARTRAATVERDRIKTRLVELDLEDATLRGHLAQAGVGDGFASQIQARQGEVAAERAKLLRQIRDAEMAEIEGSIINAPMRVGVGPSDTQRSQMVAAGKPLPKVYGIPAGETVVVAGIERRRAKSRKTGESSEVFVARVTLPDGSERLVPVSELAHIPKAEIEQVRRDAEDRALLEQLRAAGDPMYDALLNPDPVRGRPEDHIRAQRFRRLLGLPETQRSLPGWSVADDPDFQRWAARRKAEIEQVRRDDEDRALLEQLRAAGDPMYDALLNPDPVRGRPEDHIQAQRFRRLLGLPEPQRSLPGWSMADDPDFQRWAARRSEERLHGDAARQLLRDAPDVFERLAFPDAEGLSDRVVVDAANRLRDALGVPRLPKPAIRLGAGKVRQEALDDFHRRWFEELPLDVMRGLTVGTGPRLPRQAVDSKGRPVFEEKTAWVPGRHGRPERVTYQVPVIERHAQTGVTERGERLLRQLYGDGWATAMPERMRRVLFGQVDVPSLGRPIRPVEGAKGRTGPPQTPEPAFPWMGVTGGQDVPTSGRTVTVEAKEGGKFRTHPEGLQGLAAGDEVLYGSGSMGATFRAPKDTGGPAPPPRELEGPPEAPRPPRELGAGAQAPRVPRGHRVPTLTDVGRLRAEAERALREIENVVGGVEAARAAAKRYRDAEAALAEGRPVPKADLEPGKPGATVAKDELKSLLSEAQIETGSIREGGESGQLLGPWKRMVGLGQKAETELLAALASPSAKEAAAHLRTARAAMRKMEELRSKLKPGKVEPQVQPPAKQPEAAGLEIEFGGKRYKVESIRDAQAKWEQFRDASGEGVSGIGNGIPVYRDGKQIAKITYNARAWDMSGKEIGGPGEAHVQRESERVERGVAAYTQRESEDFVTGEVRPQRVEYRVRKLKLDGSMNREYESLPESLRLKSSYILEARTVRGGKVVEDWRIQDAGSEKGMHDSIPSDATMVSKGAVDAAARRQRAADAAKAKADAENASVRKIEDRVKRAVEAGDASPLSFSRGEVRRMTTDGRELQSGNGLVSKDGIWGILYLNRPQTVKDRFAVIHMPTGMFAAHASSQAMAKAKASRLSATGFDWSSIKSGKDISGHQDKDTMRVLFHVGKDDTPPAAKRGQAGMVFLPFGFGRNRNERRVALTAHGGDVRKASEAWRWRNIPEERPHLGRAFREDALEGTLDKLRSQGMKPDELSLISRLQGGDDIDAVRKDLFPHLTVPQMAAVARTAHARALDAADELHAKGAFREEADALSGRLALFTRAWWQGREPPVYLTHGRIKDLARADMAAGKRPRDVSSPKGALSVRRWYGELFSSTSAEFGNAIFEYELKAMQERNAIMSSIATVEGKVGRLAKLTGGSGIKGLHETMFGMVRPEVSHAEVALFDALDGGRRLNGGQQMTPEQVEAFVRNKAAEYEKLQSGAGQDFLAAHKLYKNLWQHMRRRHLEVYGREISESIGEGLYAPHMWYDDDGNMRSWSRLARPMTDAITSKVWSRFTLAREGNSGYIPDVVMVARHYFPAMLRKFALDEQVKDGSVLEQTAYGERVNAGKWLGGALGDGLDGQGRIADNSSGSYLRRQLNALASVATYEGHRRRLYAWVSPGDLAKLTGRDGAPVADAGGRADGWLHFLRSGPPLKAGDSSIWLREAREGSTPFEVPLTRENLSLLHMYRGGLLELATDFGQPGRLEHAQRYMDRVKLADPQAMRWLDNSLTRVLRSWTYQATLGSFAPKPALNNLAGGLFMLASNNGLGATARGLHDAMGALASARGFEEQSRVLRRMGVIEEEGVILEGRGSYHPGGALTGSVQGAGFVLFKGVEDILRSSSGLTGYRQFMDHAMPVVSDVFGRNGIKRDEMLTLTGGRMFRADGTEVAGGDRLAALIYNQTGMPQRLDREGILAAVESSGILHGRATVAKTQFFYSAAFTPEAFQGPIGRIVFQLQQFPIRAAMALWDTAWQERDHKRLVRYLATSIALQGAAALWKRDLGAMLGPSVGDLIGDATWDTEDETLASQAKKIRLPVALAFSQGAPFVPLGSFLASLGDVAYKALGGDPTNPLPEDWTTEDALSRALKAWDESPRRWKSAVRSSQWARAAEFAMAPQDEQGRRQISYGDRTGHVLSQSVGDFALEELLPGNTEKMANMFRRSSARMEAEDERSRASRRYRANEAEMAAAGPQDSMRTRFMERQQAELESRYPHVSRITDSSIQRAGREMGLPREIVELSRASIPTRWSGYHAWKLAASPGPAELRSSFAHLFGGTPQEFLQRYRLLAQEDRSAALRLRKEWNDVMHAEAVER